MSFASSGSQREPQSTLMTFQPAPRNAASSSWMILPLPRTGPSSRCRLQLTTNTRLSSFSRTGMVSAPMRLGLVHLAVAEERPDLAVGGLREAAVLQVADEARLVDRHHRARGPSTPWGTARSPASARDADRTRGRRRPLPGGSAQLLFGEAPFEDRRARRCRARNGPGRTPCRRDAVAEGARQKWLKPTSYSVARGGVARRCGRRTRRRCGSPAPPSPARSSGCRPRGGARARGCPDTPLLARRDGVDVGRVRLERQVGAGAARVVDEPLEQEVRALRAVRLQHRVDGLEPFLRFDGIEIFELREFCHTRNLF